MTDRGMWATRTIRDGAVRFYGRTFKVAPTQRVGYKSDPPYDGRLDGLRGVFYSCGGNWYPESVFLHSFGDEWPGPNCIDGKFRWERWDAILNQEGA